MGWLCKRGSEGENSRAGVEVWARHVCEFAAISSATCVAGVRLQKGYGLATEEGSRHPKEPHPSVTLSSATQNTG